METGTAELELQARRAREATRELASLSTTTKNRALRAIALSLRDATAAILTANRADYDEARASGMSEVMLDRLLLTGARIEAMAGDVLTVASLPDPIGREFDSRRLPNGLLLSKRRVPLGVIAAIYESRPNVTIDISSLCLKSGNACILRGGKEARRSNLALARLVQDACRAEGVPEGAVEFVESTDRSLVMQLLRMRQYVDLVIPRGGAELIR
ncbi:MAG: aldehyde dehydrogenase family protein, partial [Dehalococcoidia bacterium]|nr:aldehyde dehydrogenase family protein [Dehalococcoidia bacterium]